MRNTIIGTVAAAALVLAGCGSSGKAADSPPTAAPSAVTEATGTTVATTSAPAGASAVDSTVAPASSAAPTTIAAATVAAAAAGPACAGLGGAGSGETADVKLVEWSIDAPASLTAGAVTLNITNTGDNPHNLAVVKGSTWETLPKGANGGLDDAKLAPGALLGKTANISGGKSCSTTLTLEAGSYVVLCTLGFGGNSHAARGQHADITVA